jgi:hypothetical protein
MLRWGVGGVTTVLDIMQLPALTPRQISSLAKHGPNGEYAGALLLPSGVLVYSSIYMVCCHFQEHALRCSPLQFAVELVSPSLSNV